MHRVGTTNPLPARQGVTFFSWNLYSLALIALFVFFQTMQWPLLPKFLDIYYHLGVVNGFEQAGGYTSHAFWEFAPAGRDHLYPPLLHILIWGLHRGSLSLLDAGRIVDALSFPALMLTLWQVTRRIYTPRAAFFAVLIFSSSYSVYLAAATLPAFNLALIMGLWGILAIHQNKPVTAVLSLGLAFYAHTMAAWMFLIAVIFYGVFSPRQIKILLTVALGALCLGAPILIPQWIHRDSFVILRLKENRQLEFDPTVYWMALGGIAVALKKKKTYGIPFCLILGALPMIFVYPLRFTSGQGILAFALLAAFALDWIFETIEAGSNNGRRAVGCLVAVVGYLSFVAPLFFWNLKEQTCRLEWFDRSLTHFIVSDDMLRLRPRGFTIYFPKDYDEIVQCIKANSQPDDLIWSDFAHAGGILSVLSGRATSSAMLAEVRPSEVRDPIRDARILIWFKDKFGNAPVGMRKTEAYYRMSLLAETGLAYVYQNPSGYSKRVIIKADVPWAFIMILFTLMIFAVLFEQVKNRRIPKNINPD